MAEPGPPPQAEPPRAEPRRAEPRRRQPGPPPRTATPRPRPTAKLAAYVGLAALGALAALVLGRPALLAASAPFAVYVGVALALDRPDGPGTVTLAPLAPPRRAREEQTLSIALTARAQRPVTLLTLELEPGAGLRAAGDRVDRGRPLRVLARLAAGEERAFEFDLVAAHWGAPRVGVLRGSVSDRFGVLERVLPAWELGRIGVLPEPETIRRLIDPARLRATFGSRVARGRGDGIEFAEVRAHHPGDPLRRINWPVSARRGALYVSDRHPELSADVVLFLDTFSDVGEEAHRSTLELGVRTAAALAAGYAARRDRVGVVGFGGVLSGLRPGLGAAHAERVVDLLIASEVQTSWAAKEVAFVPPRLLPPRALVVALSPLVDPRGRDALLDLRRRGFDLVVLELSPEPFLPVPRDAEAVLARRLWRLHREALRSRLRALGIVTVVCDPDTPPAVPVLAAARARRHAGRALQA